PHSLSLGPCSDRKRYDAMVRPRSPGVVIDCGAARRRPSVVLLKALAYYSFEVTLREARGDGQRRGRGPETRHQGSGTGDQGAGSRDLGPRDRDHGGFNQARGVLAYEAAMAMTRLPWVELPGMLVSTFAIRSVVEVRPFG